MRRASVNNKADNQACKSLGGVLNGVQTNTNKNVYAIN
ncbi:hypothetical protein Emin_0778 [Elusimicrobium minutum Pei191]|uniref:Uncharacterized protein n=1 Tax=Elusimicrobium minutum (strain Pei191) TaxID=445932 RepID=B2KCT7_ELUMP|nr:hypothetical protein Emin_0778 [Elusimicrobium minutum Pei191]